MVIIMRRQNRVKKIGKMPEYRRFTSEKQDCLKIILSLEEYETIRLIDYLGYSQLECAQMMEISRSSVVSLYHSARNKISRFIIEGHTMEIDGGHYQLEYSEGEKEMKIAVTCVEGEVFQHFGHCPSFLVCDIKDGKIDSSQMIDTSTSGCGALAGVLSQLGVDTVICGGIGGGAKNHLNAAGIKVLPGASGNALAQVQSYIEGTLNYNPETECNHHEHECQGQHHCH